MKGRRWTPSDDAQLTALWRAGHRALSITRMIGRTELAVYDRVKRLRLVRAPLTRTWSDEDDRRLVELSRAGVKQIEIAAVMDLTPKQVKRRLFKLWTEDGLRRRVRVQRRCLCCRSTFASQGPHHRLCAICRTQDAGPEPVVIGHW